MSPEKDPASSKRKMLQRTERIIPVRRRALLIRTFSHGLIHGLRGQSLDDDEHNQANQPKIDPNKPLPVEYVTPQSGEHLYMNGAAFWHRDANTKRYFLHYPALFLLIIGFIFCRSMVVLMLPQEYYHNSLLIWLGDVSHIMTLRVHFNVLLITFDYIVYFTTVLEYYVYRRWVRYGIWPNNRPFDLAAGLLTPASVGIYNAKKLKYFALFVHHSLSTCSLFLRYLDIFVFIAFFSVFLLRLVYINDTILWIVCFVHSLFWALKNHIFFSNFVFHSLHLFIICAYLRLKFDTLESIVEQMIVTQHHGGGGGGGNTNNGNNSSSNERQVNTVRMNFFISTTNAVMLELHKYNTDFWSSYIFCIWSGFMVNIALFIFAGLFGNYDSIVVRIIIAITVSVEVIFVTSFFWTASAVNLKAREFYLTMTQASLKLCNFPTVKKFKYACWTEIISSNQIGFTCGKIFSMNYFFFYEMVAFVACLFLKLVQLQNS